MFPGRYCYTGAASRHSEVRIKEHKYNLAKGLLEKIKISQIFLRRRSQIMLEGSESHAD
jgi:hypothetical protein